MFTIAFWKGAGERAIKTFFQASIAVVTADTAGILDVQWGQLASVAGLAALISVFTSLANADFVAATPKETV